MRIQVKAFANFREILGADKEIELNEGSTIRELLNHLASSKKKLKQAMLEESGSVRDYLIIMKNRKIIDTQNELDGALIDGDEIAILPPVAGG